MASVLRACRQPPNTATFMTASRALSAARVAVNPGPRQLVGPAAAAAAVLVSSQLIRYLDPFGTAAARKPAVHKDGSVATLISAAEPQAPPTITVVFRSAVGGDDGVSPVTMVVVDREQAGRGLHAASGGAGGWGRTGRVG